MSLLLVECPQICNEFFLNLYILGLNSNSKRFSGNLLTKYAGRSLKNVGTREILLNVGFPARNAHDGGTFDTYDYVAPTGSSGAWGGRG